MIENVSSKANNSVLNRLVEIHKKCILETNSKYYDSKQIEEWVSSINIQNIRNQLKNTSWVVIKDKDKIFGFAQYSIDDKELYQIQIDPDEQGKGYGKKLYEHIEKEFRKLSISDISLFATLNAVPFYKVLGFKILKNTKYKLINTDIEMVEMIKILN